MCVGRYEQNTTASQSGIAKFAHQANALDNKYANTYQGYGAVSQLLEF